MEMDSTDHQGSERGTHRTYAYQEELAERIARAVPEDGAIDTSERRSLLSTRMRSRLSHLDRSGRVRMVDVGAKPETERTAVAEGFIRMSAVALRAVRSRKIKKGDLVRQIKG